jgi:general secretion pathway protein G
VPSGLPESNTANWRGPYSKQDIHLDPWGHAYNYELINKDAYRLYSSGPDGIKGNSDDVIGVAGNTN